MGVLSVRLDPELEEKLAFLMKQKKIVDKSAYIRQLISKSLIEDLTDFLCNEVKRKNVSTWKASEILKISLRAMLSELAKRNIASYDENAFQDDINFMRKL
ncbi:MAG: hypothetical protein ACTSVY_10245 [Candidatus Helarchaeota archaeon]